MPCEILQKNPVAILSNYRKPKRMCQARTQMRGGFTATVAPFLDRNLAVEERKMDDARTRGIERKEKE
jgi:hypothetical protein